MATSSSILPHSIRHWYLRAARARLRRDVSPPFLGLLARQPDLMELVRNIDHRLAQTPFHETHRTFAQVDYTIGLFLPSGEFAALRGWVVDLDDYVATIRFPDVASADQFVHLGDARPDVARHLPAERTSGSGFVALVPLAAVRSRHRITLSYTVRSGSSHTFSMPLPPLVFGVRHPPVPEREPPVAGNAAGILLTAVNDAQSVDIAARIEAGLSAFDSYAGDWSRAGAEKPAIEGETDPDIAGAIGRARSACRLIAVVGPLTSESYNDLVPTLVAAFPHPRLVWISPTVPATESVDALLLEVIVWQEGISSASEIARRLGQMANGGSEAPGGRAGSY